MYMFHLSPLLQATVLKLLRLLFPGWMLWSDVP